ncbi:MAG: nicotinamide-nucleotide adenylyltransferase [Candidatus Burarchaeum sp.]|nr:nicotinamide-nucleotide adenylyltransferase [Candidatus Burarchaeum sp.]MDO8340061.1 nicotinamide-nucleotide adenylyltransferase [Candidatus Burarchaeum sp.]
MIGLFIGRFQPLHNGHLEAIRKMQGECGEVIIIVGSSQYCFEANNPFTIGERIEMITASLKDAGLWGKCQVLSIPDIQNNALWVAHVNSLVPHYDVVYSNNPLTRRLFKEAGKRIESIPFHDRKNCDGTKIRGLMITGGEWEKFVPAKAAVLIKRVKGPERMKEVGNGDKFEDRN